jgi:hypothetical protein
VVERYVQLSAISGVDEIIPYNTEEELVDLLLLYRIDVRFIGEDYKDKPFTGDDLPMEIFFNRRDHRFSSSGLKQAVIKNQETKQLEGNVVKDNDTYIIVDNTELTKLTVSTTTLRPGKETTGHYHEDMVLFIRYIILHMMKTYSLFVSLIKGEIIEYFNDRVQWLYWVTFKTIFRR